MTDPKLSARVVQQGGMPQLSINGKAVAPLIFFFNTEVEGGMSHLEPQVRMAAQAGVHIYSFPMPWPFYEEGVEPDYSTGEEFIHQFLEIDPQALFILRVRSEGSPEWMNAHPEECITYPHERQKGGHSTFTTPRMTSMASKLWIETLEKSMTQNIQHYESGPYADHILGYHPAGQNSCEWFHFEYYINGPDVSDVNQRGFREWLNGKYGNDQTLATSWGRPGLKLAEASIPIPVPNPERGEKEIFRIFLDQPSEQDRIDYHEYSSWAMADGILRICSHVRRETRGKKLVVLFYGYFFELMGVAGGHYQMQRVLSSPDIDILNSPISYRDRQPGGPASFMTAVDSVAIHQKLWVTENDYNTSVLNTDDLPEWMTPAGLGPKAADLRETLEVIRRDFGSIYVHRCGTWWMDLVSAGAFEHPAIWEMIGSRLKPLYDEMLTNPAPYVPEVAVIVDEEASARGMRFAGPADGEIFNPVQEYGILYGREKIAGAGVALGHYYLNDFLEGRVPRAKVYCFINLYFAPDALIEQIHRRLREEGATAIWQYAPGWRGEGDDRLDRMRRLTGLRLAEGEGRQGSAGEGRLDGLKWGQPVMLRPRFNVDDPAAEVLGRYAEGQGVSAARMRKDGWTSIFLADAALDSQLFLRLFEDAGAHIWLREGSFIQTDGRMLFVHAASAGRKLIELPSGMHAQSLSGPLEEIGPGRVQLKFEMAQTHILRLVKD